MCTPLPGLPPSSAASRGFEQGRPKERSVAVFTVSWRQKCVATAYCEDEACQVVCLRVFQPAIWPSNPLQRVIPCACDPCLHAVFSPLAARGGIRKEVPLLSTTSKAMPPAAPTSSLLKQSLAPNPAATTAPVTKQAVSGRVTFACCARLVGVDGRCARMRVL